MIEKAISEAARDVLGNARVEGNILYLPPQQLERKLYEEVNEVLTRLGGKWKGGKVKGHVFDTDPSSDLEVIVQTGFMPPKNPMAFFSTPKPVLDWILHYLDVNLEIRKGLHFLEPSAGKGAIAFALRDHLEHWRLLADSVIHVCEIQPAYASLLEAKGFEVVARDFLTFTPNWTYDAILMNPPFSVEGDKQAYITHILHAWEMVSPGGIVVAIASPGFTFEGRREKKLQDFFTLVEEEGRWDELPEESFKESGTGIKTVILMLKKSHESAILPSLREDETMLRARNIPDLVSLDNAYELTRAIEQAEAQRVAKDVPVFGDSVWISRAKKKRAS